ncbi:MAG: serine hydrolase [Clostridia bacterium]|nr:serine hydrolase [Clostridia bacterium]
MMQKKHIFRAITALVSALLLCSFPVFSVSAAETPSPERIGAAYLYNIENDKVIFEYNSEAQLYPAASVKVMSAIVAYEALSDKMDTYIDITKEMISGASGNHIAIEAGERIIVRDLFYAMLLKGANDAAYVLSYAAHGSLSAFVDQMNVRAAQLGMTQTHYTNPTGMHDELMLSSAYDQAQAAKVFCSYTELVEMSSVSKHVIEKTDHCQQRNIYNRNAFVSKVNSLGTIKYYYEYAKGVSFGSTDEAGDSFVTMAQKDGLSYICVILGGEESENGENIYAFEAATALLDYALDGFGYVEVLNTEKFVHDMPVTLSEETDRVMLIPAGKIKAYLPYDIDIDTDITYTYTLSCESLTAPVKEGQAVGHISVYYGDTLLGTEQLVTQNEVKLSAFLSTLEHIKTFTKSKFFICTSAALIVVTVGFVLINSFVRDRKRRKRSVRYR